MRIAIAIVLLVCAGFTAHADQRDQRLDALFSALLDATPESFAPIEREVWRIWIESDNPATFGVMQTGIFAMQAGELDTALNAFDVLVERAPDFAEAWNKRATVLFYLGDYEASLSDVAKTLELEPRHFGALSGAGLIFDEIGQPEAALRAYREALAVHPNLPYPLMRVQALEDEMRGQPL